VQGRHVTADTDLSHRADELMRQQNTPVARMIPEHARAITGSGECRHTHPDWLISRSAPTAAERKRERATMPHRQPLAPHLNDSLRWPARTVNFNRNYLTASALVWRSLTARSQ
jgi:hypothetical protein